MARLHTVYQVQHRPRRETKEVEQKTELQMLRAENQKLKRENARLRRENEKLTNLQANYDEFAEDNPPPMKVEAPVVKADDSCPEGCRVELRRIVTPFKTIVVCPECHWRKTE